MDPWLPPSERDAGRPSILADTPGWLKAVGLVTAVLWNQDDWAVFTADRPSPDH